MDIESNEQLYTGQVYAICGSKSLRRGN